MLRDTPATRESGVIPPSHILRKEPFPCAQSCAYLFSRTAGNHGKLSIAGHSSLLTLRVASAQLFSVRRRRQAVRKKRYAQARSLHEWQRGGRRRRRGQSHSEKLPLRGRRWPPMACRSPQTSSVLLWCAWRPSSSSSSRRGSATVTVIGLGS